MTKEEIAKKYVPCRCDEAYTSRGLTAPDCPYHANDPEAAMDEYAKQQAIAFMKSEDATHNQLVRDNVYEEMYRQFTENQFIEQQQNK